MKYLLRCAPLVLCVCALLASGCTTVNGPATNTARIDGLETRVNQALRAAQEARRDASQAIEVVEDAQAYAAAANVRATEAVLLADKAIEVAQDALRAAADAIARLERLPK